MRDNAKVTDTKSLLFTVCITNIINFAITEPFGSNRWEQAGRYLIKTNVSTNTMCDWCLILYDK